MCVRMCQLNWHQTPGGPHPKERMRCVCVSVLDVCVSVVITGIGAIRVDHHSIKSAPRDQTMHYSPITSNPHVHQWRIHLMRYNLLNRFRLEPSQHTATSTVYSYRDV